MKKIATYSKPAEEKAPVETVKESVTPVKAAAALTITLLCDTPQALAMGALALDLGAEA